MKKVFSLSTPPSDGRFWLDRKINHLFNTIERVDFKKGFKKIMPILKIIVIIAAILGALYFIGNVLQPGFDPVPLVPED